MHWIILIDPILLTLYEDNYKNRNRSHWLALNRLTKYLGGAMNYRILYSGFLIVLEGCNDVNWIIDLDETKLANGFAFTVGGG